MIKLKKRSLSQVKKLEFLLLPILLAVFPLLSFYFSNIAELSLKFITRPLLYSLIVVIAATGLLFLLLKDKDKSSFITSLLVFIFFSYGHLSNSLNSKLFIQLPKGIVLGPDKILLPLVFLFTFFLVFKIIRSRKDFSSAVSFFRFSLLALVLGLALLVINSERQKKNSQLVQSTEPEVSGDLAKEDTPDIYYIILDGYARKDVLKEVYQYDNSPFINSLRKMGFYVADQARSNYIHTYLSLPSTLNMRYLDDLPEKYGTNPTSGIAARQLTAKNKVVKKLKQFGYTIINFVSTWEGTDESLEADISYKGEDYFKIFGKNLNLDETEIVFLQTTLLSPLIKHVWGDTLRSRTMATLQKLPTIPYQEGKKFVIAHIISPHPPYVFTAEGKPVAGAELEMADEGIDKRPKYIGQLIFISNQIIPVLEKIIKNSRSKPIIILQADHGPASIFGKRDDWLKNYSNEGIKERSSILYAIYFPDQDYHQFYSTITPVNTFRILFNKYFNENLKLLPDKTFYTSYEAIYDFKDVTDIK